MHFLGEREVGKEKEMKKIIFLIPLLLISFVANNPLRLFADNAPETLVRVLIMDDRNSLKLSLKGRYELTASNPEHVIMEGPSLSADVAVTKDGILVGTREIKAGGISVKAYPDGNVYVDGRRFRGSVGIIRKDNCKLMVINHLPLDEYLYGVLYHEVSHRWPMEVLKAQAITARTFALYQVRQSKAQPYDLRSDIYSQVYGGKTSEKWSTTAAVDKTRGQILTYKADIFPTYYHATCGGYTEDAANLWNVDLAPLKGAPCNFCSDSPHYKWTKNILLWALENKLKENGYKLGKISTVTILSKNKSGRVDKIEIKDDAGTSIILTGKDFRQMLGPNEVSSTKFDLSLKWGSLVFDGLGWGHGVGMCQWGAYGQARSGKKVDEILKYYYPGAEISTIDKIKL